MNIASIDPVLAPELDEQVLLTIPIAALSTQHHGVQTYHFGIIDAAYQIRKYLATALRSRPYRLSEDADYVEGRLHFPITSTIDDAQPDMMEGHRIYAQAALDMEHALRYLSDPVETVNEGLESGRPKTEFQGLSKAAKQLVNENQKQCLEAAVSYGDKVTTVTGTIAPPLAQREAIRRLKPPVNSQVETLTLTFIAQESDGVLLTDHGELFDPEGLRDKVPLHELVSVEANLEKTRVIRDVRRITRLLSRNEESQK